MQVSLVSGSAEQAVNSGLGVVHLYLLVREFSLYGVDMEVFLWEKVFHSPHLQFYLVLTLSDWLISQEISW